MITGQLQSDTIFSFTFGTASNLKYLSQNPTTRLADSIWREKCLKNYYYRFKKQNVGVAEVRETSSNE